MNQATDKPADKPLARIERMVVSSEVPIMDTGMFDHMTRIAKLMAASSLVPAHLNSVRREGGNDIPIEEGEAIANCFLVVNQAFRWRMDPFAVAQHVYVTKGRVGYEGKLIAAVINSHPQIEKRLTYSYSGEGEGRKVVVSAKLKDDTQERTVEGTVAAWKTTGSGSPWLSVNQRDQMLSYRGAREWARRWLPEAVLGVWGDDELEFMAQPSRLAGESSETERSGSARLRTSLASGGAEDATVLTDKPEPAKTDKPEPATQAAASQDQPTPAPAQPAKPPAPGELGTAALRDKYIAAFNASTDVDVLNLKRDEINFLKWPPEDLKLIDEAYRKRLTELKVG